MRWGAQRIRGREGEIGVRNHPCPPLCDQIRHQAGILQAL